MRFPATSSPPHAKRFWNAHPARHRMMRLLRFAGTLAGRWSYRPPYPRCAVWEEPYWCMQRHAKKWTALRNSVSMKTMKTMLPSPKLRRRGSIRSSNGSRTLRHIAYQYSTSRVTMPTAPLCPSITLWAQASFILGSPERCSVQHIRLICHSKAPTARHFRCSLREIILSSGPHLGSCTPARHPLLWLSYSAPPRNPRPHCPAG